MSKDQWNNLKAATINYCDYLNKSGLSACDAKRFLNELWKEYIEPAESNQKSNTDETNDYLDRLKKKTEERFFGK